MNRHSRLLAGVLGITLAGLVLVPTLASARGRAMEIANGTCKIFGSYAFDCEAPLSRNFPGTPATLALGGTYFSGLINSTLPPSNCPPPAVFAVMNASYPAVGQAWAYARIIGGAGGAGFGSGGNNIAAVDPDTTTDSLGVIVNRTVPGQVTVSIRGTMTHLNPGTGGGTVSRVSYTVYPDSTNAFNETNPIPNSTGSIVFVGTSNVNATGQFKAGDVSGPIQIGNGDFQVTVNPGFQKTIAVPNAATAVVVAVVDPRVSTRLPGSSPLVLVLLSGMLLIGGTWFLMARNHAKLA